MKAVLAAEGGGKSINAQSTKLSNDGNVHGKENRVDERWNGGKDDGSERKRCTLLFGGRLRRLSEHMEVLKEAMSKLSCDLQNYEEKREWYRWRLMHGGRAAIECKADKLMADAVERAVHYDSDVTGHYDSGPEVVDIDVDYEERMMEEDVVEQPHSRGRKSAPPLLRGK